MDINISWSQSNEQEALCSLSQLYISNEYQKSIDKIIHEYQSFTIQILKQQLFAVKVLRQIFKSNFIFQSWFACNYMYKQHIQYWQINDDD